MLEACRTACGACAEECERHAAMHDHCQICAEACRRCEQACDALLSSIA
ncbi:four-helix bundle copper-binding protein [Escherichia coli]